MLLVLKSDTSARLFDKIFDFLAKYLAQSLLLVLNSDLVLPLFGKNVKAQNKLTCNSNSDVSSSRPYIHQFLPSFGFLHRIKVARCYTLCKLVVLGLLSSNIK